MKKIIFKLVAFTFLLNVFTAKADEGMWLPLLVKRLNYADMQSKGLKLTADEIYSVNKSSLKDAIVSLGGFCTGEMISSQGLMLTNHHCGFDAIQQFSDTNNNYLKDGFWAMNKGEELNVPGLTATFLVRMEDVTTQATEGVNDNMSESERNDLIRKNIKAIVDEATKENHYSAYVKDFFHGNEFYLFVNETFKDVRLVGAPPSAVGKYGGDTDNWMWPRQTGDFCMFRVYAGEDNKPADYSSSNKPFEPRHHLPVSLKGVTEGDYAMIMGYPGSTDRFMNSFEVKFAVEKEQPARVKIRRKKLDIMEKYMSKSEAVKIKYASKHAQVSNYWKYFLGQSKQLTKNKVYDRKKAEEEAFTKWVHADADREKRYGTVLNDMSNAVKELEDENMFNTYFFEAIYGVDLNKLMFRTSGLYQALQADTTKEVQAQMIQGGIARVKPMVADHFKNYDVRVDREMYANMLLMYIQDMPKENVPAELSKIAGSKDLATIQKVVDKLYNKSVFSSEEKFNKFLEKPSLKTLKKDKLFQLANGMLQTYYASGGEREEQLMDKLDKGKRLFVEGLRKMNPDKAYAPDANSTQRLTYGNVGSYNPADGVKYKYYTTAEGILEKYIPGDDEFDLPQDLIKLLEKKDYGQYADKSGDLRVCFISNNDITGGNSGSPVINAEGHLIGTAFDGNWEAMSGDIAFETNLQRTISVDVRYTLFIVDKYAGAKHLIEEMTIIK